MPEISEREPSQMLESPFAGDVITVVVMTIVWKLTGWWLRKRDVSLSGRRESLWLRGVSWMAVFRLFLAVPQP